MCEVMRWGNLHPVMNMNERGNLQTSSIQKTNWNFGIFMVKVLFFPYKSTTCAVPIYWNKLESDWNLCAITWNSNLLEQIPTFWNRVGILEPTSGLGDALYKLPSMPTHAHIVTRAKTKNWSQKIETKKYRPIFRLGGLGENVTSYCMQSSRLLPLLYALHCLPLNHSGAFPR